MVPHLKKLLSSILATSLASLLQGGSTDTSSGWEELQLTSLIDSERKGKRPMSLLEMKQAVAREFSSLARGHSSHSSHRSHSSHSSHRSSSSAPSTHYSSSSVPNTHYSSSYTPPATPSTVPEPQKSVKAPVSPPGKDAPAPPVPQHRLGDRVLKNGETGADVQELIALLEMHGFLIPQVGDACVYNGGIRNAIRTVQCFGGLEVTGETDAGTIDFLTGWIRQSPRIRRKLLKQSYSWSRPIGKDMTGPDVRDLALLLSVQGVLDKHRISHLNRRETICDNHMVQAIRLVQRKAGLPETGVADEATIAALVNLLPAGEEKPETGKTEKAGVAP